MPDQPLTNCTDLDRDPDLASVLQKLSTEMRDPALSNVDKLSIEERCELQNRSDKQVAAAVAAELPRIVDAVKAISRALKSGGRLFYIGAGTSGRLGVLDASECPPTFGTDPALVQGIIAGGNTALTNAIEGVEDSPVAGATDIGKHGVNAPDVVVGITASGRTPYVLGALRRANEIGALTLGVTNNRDSELEAVCTGPCIAAVVGPEFVSGSTRLKAGTATKVILNTVTTLAMVRLGKGVGNLMVDMNVSNRKLRERALRIVQAVTGADAMAAHAALEKCHWKVKLACQRLG